MDLHHSDQLTRSQHFSCQDQPAAVSRKIPTLRDRSTKLNAHWTFYTHTKCGSVLFYSDTGDLHIKPYLAVEIHTNKTYHIAYGRVASLIVSCVETSWSREDCKTQIMKLIYIHLALVWRNLQLTTSLLRHASLINSTSAHLPKYGKRNGQSWNIVRWHSCRSVQNPVYLTLSMTESQPSRARGCFAYFTIPFNLAWQRQESGLASLVITIHSCI